MSVSALQPSASRSVQLLSATLAAAVAGSTSTPITGLAGMKHATVIAVFVRVGGGTTAKFWVQTSLDGGATWIDIMCFAFTTTTATKVSGVDGAIALAAAVTPSDGTLADDTIVNGLIGDRLRVKYTTTGTYTGASTIAIGAVTKG